MHDLRDMPCPKDICLQQMVKKLQDKNILSSVNNYVKFQFHCPSHKTYCVTPIFLFICSCNDYDFGAKSKFSKCDGSMISLQPKVCFFLLIFKEMFAKDIYPLFKLCI